jgi:predicted hotdog family 3-hydroxylacyl-ACP dehydratase
MVLLDAVIAAGAEELTSVLTVREESRFFDGAGVGAWVGVEYMAQTIAAFAGYEALQNGTTVKPGFLLGARRYSCNTPAFPLGVTLRVTARRELQNADGIGSFNCSITGDGIAADANLVVFQPDSLDAYLITDRDR